MQDKRKETYHLPVAIRDCSKLRARCVFHWMQNVRAKAWSGHFTYIASGPAGKAHFASKHCTGAFHQTRENQLHTLQLLLKIETVTECLKLKRVLSSFPTAARKLLVSRCQENTWPALAFTAAEDLTPLVSAS